MKRALKQWQINTTQKGLSPNRLIPVFLFSTKRRKVNMVNTSNSFAIKEVMNFAVERFVPSGRGDILLYVDYAGQTNLSTTAERLPIRGGQGNFKIMDLDHTKDCEFAATLPLVDTKALAIKLGKDIKKGATETPYDGIMAVGAGGVVTLPERIVPIAGTLKVYTVKFDRDIDQELTVGETTPAEGTYVITEQEIKVDPETCPEGSRVYVSCDYMSGTAAQNLKITASDFPHFITIRGIGLVDDDQAGVRIPVTFKVHKAKVRPEFELTMAGDAATELDFTTDCYTILNKDNEREFVDIVKLNDEAK